MDCTIENRTLVPLSKAVSASIIDTYGDIGKMEQRLTHFAARELKKLYNEVLPKKKHKVVLTVNANTHTATLPEDFDEETFIGIFDSRGMKVPLKLNTNIVDLKNITEVECEDKCEKCNQDKSICNDLVVTQETNLIVINATTYEQTIVKKLYPNGDYYLETSTPILDIDTNNVTYSIKKEFIVNFDLKPCGCLETTETNLTNLQTFCNDIYCCYYASCDYRCSTNYGGYNIFVETGLIQFDTNYNFSKVYMEYNGFIQKVRGQYMIPQVAFETVVEGTKYRQIKNKMNVPDITIRRWYDNYRIERGNMMKNLTKISLFNLVQSTKMLPKFDWDYDDNWYGSFCNGSSSSFVSNSGISVTTNASGECCITNPTTIINRTAYVLNVKVDGAIGSPVSGASSYQNNILIGATDLVYIFLAKQILTLKDGDFTFNNVTGTIDISPNTLFTGDTLIAHFNKST